jgi:hypothetical protein
MTGSVRRTIRFGRVGSNRPCEESDRCWGSEGWSIFRRAPGWVPIRRWRSISRSSLFIRATRTSSRDSICLPPQGPGHRSVSVRSDADGRVFRRDDRSAADERESAGHVLKLYRRSAKRRVVGRQRRLLRQRFLFGTGPGAGGLLRWCFVEGQREYRPDVAGSGYGGISEGAYDLRLNFRPDAFSSIVDIDNAQNPLAGHCREDSAGRQRGRGAGRRVQFLVPSGSAAHLCRQGGSGAAATAHWPPRSTIWFRRWLGSSHGQQRHASRGPGGGQRRHGRIVATPEDARPYEIGFDLARAALADGSRLEVPQERDGDDRPRGGVQAAARLYRRGQFVPVDRPQRRRIAGPGTPRLLDANGNVIRDTLGQPIPGSVYFTSYNDERLGGDSNPAVPQTPAPGDWGGLIFRNQLDRSTGRKTSKPGVLSSTTSIMLISGTAAARS